MKTSQDNHEITSTEIISNGNQLYSPDQSEFPVIKINLQGRILYANRASFQLLREWLCTPEQNLPEFFLMSNPGLLNAEADFSMPLVTRSIRLNFDVIGFKEQGYIGLYGFEGSVPQERITEVLEFAN